MKFNRRMFGLLAVVLTVSFFCSGETPAQSRKAKNVIVMIGDGMGFNSDLAGTYWRFGEADAQSYHKFPKHLACTTFSITSDDYDAKKVKGYDPNVFWNDLKSGRAGTALTQTTDSAASATAINSGKKTLNGRLGMDFKARPVKQYSMYAAEAGRSVGVVTTVTFPHATPGAVMAHLPSRDMYAMIAREMILDQPLSVIMGGGHPEYIDGKKTDKIDYKFVGGKDIWNELKKNSGFAGALVIDEPSDFEKLAEAVPGSGKELPKRVIGLPKSNYIAPVGSAIDDATQKELQRLYHRNDLSQLPSLTTMALGALNVLSQNQKGFYLMIEGGAIDGANHGRNIEKMVFEHAGFSKAIDAVINWIEKYSSWDDTLLFITADHETGQLWGPGTYTDANNNGIFDIDDHFNEFKPIVNKGKGVFPEVQYGYGSHTNALVPVWIKGAGDRYIDRMIRGNDAKAAEFWHFSGDYIDNTDILPFLRKASGLDK